MNAIWQGILTGLVLATFIGPIFFAVVDLGLKGNIKGVASIAFGTFISDIIWVLLIYMFAQQLVPGSALLQAMYITGGLILIGLGLRNLLTAKVTETHTPLAGDNLWGLFAKGFLINSSNPNVFFFWFGAIMVAVHKYEQHTGLVLVHFLSALMVVLSTDFLKGYIASLLRSYLPQNILVLLSRLSGLILIYFGIKLIFFH